LLGDDDGAHAGHHHRVPAVVWLVDDALQVDVVSGRRAIAAKLLRARRAVFANGLQTNAR
jgi:hypothetical protein